MLGNSRWMHRYLSVKITDFLFPSCLNIRSGEMVPVLYFGWCSLAPCPHAFSLSLHLLIPCYSGTIILDRILKAIPGVLFLPPHAESSHSSGAAWFFDVSSNVAGKLFYSELFIRILITYFSCQMHHFFICLSKLNFSQLSSEHILTHTLAHTYIYYQISQSTLTIKIRGINCFMADFSSVMWVLALYLCNFIL